MTGLTQHIGLAEDVLDHRLNSRTVYINPFSRFVYWNMNYHVEHHMFPMVPYHRLPELHQEMLNDCAKPYSGFWDAYREIIPTLWRQLRDPEYFVHRVLPATAKQTPTNMKG
jgi:fatty acid desaturase